MDFYVHEDWVLPCIHTVATTKNVASEKKGFVLRYGDVYYSARFATFFLLTIESSFYRFHYFSFIPIRNLWDTLDAPKMNNAELLQKEENDAYYVGNFFIDGFEGILKNINSISKSALKRADKETYFMSHLYTRNIYEEGKFMHQLHEDYEKLMDISVYDSKESREKQISQIQKEEILSKDRTFHVYMESKIANRLNEPFQFMVLGFEDSIFHIQNKTKDTADICSITFNEIGIPSVFSFSTDTLYPLPKDISQVVVDEELTYPFSHRQLLIANSQIKKIEIPILDDVDYLYYYAILKWHQQAQKKEEHVHESI